MRGCRMQRLVITGLDLSGADPASWEFVAMVQGHASRQPPPRGIYVCDACGRDWMMHHDACPVCEHSPLTPTDATKPANG